MSFSAEKPVAAPTDPFIYGEKFKMAAQSLCVATSFGTSSIKSSLIGAVIFASAHFLGCKFTIRNSYSKNLLNLPSKIVYENAGNHGKNFRKIYWLAPIVGIAASSLAAYNLYNRPYFSLVKGGICGAYSVAMNHFSDLPLKVMEEKEVNVFTLRDCLSASITDPERFKSLNVEKVRSIEKTANIAASVVLAVSGVAATVFFLNPILGDAVAYPLAAVTRVAVEHFLKVRESNLVAKTGL